MLLYGSHLEEATSKRTSAAPQRSPDRGVYFASLCYSNGFGWLWALAGKKMAEWQTEVLAVGLCSLFGLDTRHRGKAQHAAPAQAPHTIRKEPLAACRPRPQPLRKPRRPAQGQERNAEGLELRIETRLASGVQGCGVPDSIIGAEIFMELEVLYKMSGKTGSPFFPPHFPPRHRPGRCRLCNRGLKVLRK